MSENYRFFASSTGDVRKYTQIQFAGVFKRFMETGYIFGADNNLEVTADSPASMDVRVDTGEAFIEGYWYQNTASKDVTLDAADGALDRIDRIVVELDVIARTITAKMLKGTAAASPVAPTLTRTSDTYQISLAQVLVGAGVTSITNANITDERDDETVCGRASSAAVSLEHKETLPRLSGPFRPVYTDANVRDRGVVVIDDDIYLIGGGGGVKCTKWSHETNTWSALSDLGTGVTSPGTCYYDGKIYAIGSGYATTTNKTQIYDIATDAWSTGTDVPAGGLYHVAAIDGKIYCWAGGATTLRIYNIAGNTWSTGPVSPAAVTSPVVTDGTDIYLITGSTFRKYIVSSDSYSTPTAPTVGDALATITEASRMVYENGRIWIIYSQIGYANYTRVFCYEISSDSWLIRLYSPYFGTGARASILGTTASQTNIAYLSDGRFINPDYSAEHYSRVWTYKYKVEDAADKSKMMAFRKRTGGAIQLINFDTLTAGDTIAVQTNDNWGLYWGVGGFCPLSSSSSNDNTAEVVIYKV